jgi:hypothetical protein
LYDDGRNNIIRHIYEVSFQFEDNQITISILLRAKATDDMNDFNDSDPENVPVRRKLSEDDSSSSEDDSEHEGYTTDLKPAPVVEILE